ncbi:hypothetical protein ABE132_02315 [Peribacillus simplex]|uniref:hypothetical protein n=1 Tax=Peribacillus simplex TaxID=1478 RepID=UPI003D2E8FD8
MEPMLPPRTRTPNPLKKGLKKFTNKTKYMKIMDTLFFVALIPISTVIVIFLIQGFNWFYIKTEGIIPTSQIAKELGLNPGLIKVHFKKEG